jgi:hypothetical protein
MLGRRKKKDAVEKAAEIIAKHHAKKDRNAGLFTELQEEKRRQLGLHQTLRPDPKVVRDEKAKDPLTKRQRALLEELGLNPQSKTDQANKNQEA